MSIKRTISLTLVFAMLFGVVGCTNQVEEPSHPIIDLQPEENLPPVQEDSEESEPALDLTSEPIVPEYLEYRRTRYLTDIMPPLTPEQETMVDEQIPAELLAFFEETRTHPHRFPIFGLEHGITYGELWRYTGIAAFTERRAPLVFPEWQPGQGILQLELDLGQAARYAALMPHMMSVNYLYLRHFWPDDPEGPEGFDAFWGSLGEMTWLLGIHTDWGRFEYLPEGFRQLENLRSLRTHVTDLPDDALIGLENLERLTLWFLGSRKGSQMGPIPSETPVPFPTGVLALERLEELNLAGSHITELPSGIGGLTNLRVLELWSNPLAYISDEITLLSSLERLMLDGYRQGGMGPGWPFDENAPLATSLPEDIGNMTSLTHLSIANFPITHLPDSFGELGSLERLVLRNIPLESLPDSFANLYNLTALYISAQSDEETERLVALANQLLGRELARVVDWDQWDGHW